MYFGWKVKAELPTFPTAKQGQLLAFVAYGQLVYAFFCIVSAVTWFSAFWEVCFAFLALVASRTYRAHFALYYSGCIAVSWIAEFTIMIVLAKQIDCCKSRTCVGNSSCSMVGWYTYSLVIHILGSLLKLLAYYVGVETYYVFQAPTSFYGAGDRSSGESLSFPVPASNDVPEISYRTIDSEKDNVRIPIDDLKPNNFAPSYEKMGSKGGMDLGGSDSEQHHAGSALHSFATHKGFHRMYSKKDIETAEKEEI